MARTKRVKPFKKPQDPVSGSEGDQTPRGSTSEARDHHAPDRNRDHHAPDRTYDASAEQKPIKKPREPRDERESDVLEGPDIYFQSTPFNRLCRSITESISGCANYRWTTKALSLLQNASEQYIVDLFAKAKQFSDHAQRKKTVQYADLVLASKNCSYSHLHQFAGSIGHVQFEGERGGPDAVERKKHDASHKKRKAHEPPHKKAAKKLSKKVKKEELE